ncbi:MAG: hypothetical protein ACI94Y_001676 [Maribacter sp.]|jgi:hypothetical protein
MKYIIKIMLLISITTIVFAQDVKKEYTAEQEEKRTSIMAEVIEFLSLKTINSITMKYIQYIVTIYQKNKEEVKTSSLLQNDYQICISISKSL